MKKQETKYYCDYCSTNWSYISSKVPCPDCKGLLLSAIKESREYNKFEIFGQKWLVPIKRGFSMAVACGEGKYVKRMMKRLAKKSYINR